MLRGGEPWDGDAWEGYCNELLALHHPDAYQVIPAADRGDCGLEGHSTDGQGCGYQCFAPDAEINISQRRSRQVDKITDTINTLIEQRKRLGRMLGQHKIKRLIFLFPRHDSAEVNAHLRMKEERLRKAVADLQIEAIADDVVLAAWTVPPYLAQEAAELERTGAVRMPLPPVSVGEEDKDRLRDERAAVLQGANEKLTRRFGANRAPALVDVAIQDFLLGAEQEQHLQQRPDSYERLQRLKGRGRREITRESLEGSTYALTLADLVARIRGQIEAEVPSIDSTDADSLAAGAVAGWLIECPLDFPAPA